MKHPSAAISAGLFVGLAWLTFSAWPQQQNPTPVRVENVEVQTLQNHHKVTGNLRAVSRSEVATVEPGKVLEVYVDEADIVKEGEVLARLDEERLKIQLNQMQAQKQSTQALEGARQAELENAEWNLERLRPLRKQEMTTEQELRDAETEVSVSRAQLLSTQRELQRLNEEIELLKVRLDDMRIRAPFDGWVVQRHVETGEWINTGEAAVTLVTGGTVEAWLEIPERFKEPVHQNTNPIKLEFFDGQFQTTSIRSRIIPDVDPQVRTFNLVAVIDSQERLLVPGMSVNGWVPAGEKAEFKTVPRDAVLRDPAGFYVFKAQSMPEGGHVANPISVDLLFDHEDRVVVESRQLNDGDLVVIEGNERLRPMTPIQLISDGQTSLNSDTQADQSKTLSEKEVSSG